MTHSPFAGLRARLLLLVLLALVPALGLILYTAREQQRLADVETKANALRLARLASLEHERLIDGARQLLVVLARLPEVHGRSSTACSTLLAGLLKQYPLYANFGVVEPDGTVVCSAIPTAAPTNVAHRAYFRRAVETRNFAVGEYQIGLITGKATVNFGYPVRDDTGRVQAVIFAALDLAGLNRLAAEAQLPAGSTLTVTDRHGTVLVQHPDGERWVGRSLAGTHLAEAVLKQGTGVTEAAGVDGILRLFAFAPLAGAGGEVYVSVGVPKEAAVAGARKILARNLTGLGVVSLLALAAAWVGGDTFVLRQVNALIKATKRLSAGDLSARSGLPHGPEELSQLARAFDEMAALLERDYKTLVALYRGAQKLSKGLDLRQLVDDISRTCVEAFGACLAWLGRAEPKGGVRLLARFPVQAGPLDQAVAGREPPALEIAKRAISTGLLDVADNRCAAAFPLISGDRPVGVLTLLSEQPGFFTPDRIDFFQAYAHQAAAALQNSMLFEQQKQRASEIEELNATLERRVAERTAQLEAANRELEAYSYSVSHDLRAPLRAIDGFSQALLEDYVGLLDAQGREYLERLRAASQRMAQLLDDMLNLSRVTRGEMRRETVDLSGLARAIAAELLRRDPERQVEFAIAEGMVADGDARLLRVAFENLLGNAWKFTGKHPRAKIECGVTNHDGEAVYFVRDDGAGFDMAYADNLFGAFQRLHTMSEFEGNGIGLATVQRIIHRHGGRVWAEGEVERGATFYFTLG